MPMTIYPYLTDPRELSGLRGTTKSADTSTPEGTKTSFADALAKAERCEQAMAVDALIVQRQGGVDVETVKKLLGFDPAPGRIPANSKMPIEVPTMQNQNPNAAKEKKASGPEASMEELERGFADASEKYHVDSNLLKAIAKAESNFHSGATSSSGAMGVMQLMPQTAESLGITDAYDAYHNIMGGAQVIAQHLDRYDGNLALALAAYNAGPGNVDKYGGIPPFEETENYVKKVIGYYNS